MGLVIDPKDIDSLKRVADRERSPMHNVGEVTGDMHFSFESKMKNEKPMDLDLSDMFGSSPKTVMNDRTSTSKYSEIVYNQSLLSNYLYQIFKLESVACKDWLTNKVDRCVTGKVAKQQCTGSLQLPLKCWCNGFGL